VNSFEWYRGAHSNSGQVLLKCQADFMSPLADRGSATLSNTNGSPIETQAVACMLEYLRRTIVSTRKIWHVSNGRDAEQPLSLSTPPLVAPSAEMRVRAAPPLTHSLRVTMAASQVWNGSHPRSTLKAALYGS
jgi:hypothetical protein